MIKKNKIETVLVGIGRIAYGYNEYNKKDILTHYKALINHNKFRLSAFIEPNIYKRKKISKKLKIDGYEKLSNLKNKVFPKLVIVCSPTETHIKVIKELIKNHSSIKAILCEKPFGNDYTQSQKVLNECEKKGIKLFVNYMRISDPGVIKIKKIINAKFKKLTKGIVFYDGSTLNQASHLINLLQYWLGKVISVKKIENRKKNITHKGISFILEFKKAKIFFVGLNIVNFSYASIELISPNGRIEYSERGKKITYQNVIRDKIFGEDYLPNQKKITIFNDINNYQLNVLKQLYLNLNNKKNFLCSGVKAVETLKVINKLI